MFSDGLGLATLKSELGFEFVVQLGFDFVNFRTSLCPVSASDSLSTASFFRFDF